MYPPFDNQMGMQYFSQHVNPMSSLPYPNQSCNSFNNGTTQSWADPTMPSPQSFGMNGLGIPGMPHITNNHNPYQSLLPPLTAQSSNNPSGFLQTVLHSNHYNPMGPTAPLSSTPPSHQGSRLASPEASRIFMPPPKPPRFIPHRQSSSPQKFPSADSRGKRKRHTSSTQSHDVDPINAETEFSDDEFDRRIADAIDTPVHSPSGSDFRDNADVSETEDLDLPGSQDAVARSTVDDSGTPYYHENCSATPSTTPSSAHPDISAARTDMIAQRLHLTPEEIAETSFIYSLSNSNEQRWAQIALMTRRHQDRTASSNGAANVSTQSSLVPWAASDELCTEVRKLLSKLIIQIEIQSYTGRTPKAQEPKKFSLDNITLCKLRQLAKQDFYAAVLPSGFVDKKPGASSAPLALIKATAVYLLVHLIGKTKDQPVPDLKGLVGIVTRFRRRNDRRSDDEIWKATSDDLAYRYALLQLIGIKYELAPSKGCANGEPLPKSMWTWVDDRLRWIAKLPPPSQAGYRELVMETDRKYFDGTSTFAAIMTAHNGCISLPDEHEWQATTSD
ncbi:hypothetical protein DFH28DRAFT_927219 [Melampsora americana]|nr:hypothetical protein DFH28DRAFT_927219 [Melampsora americana]